MEEDNKSEATPLTTADLIVSLEQATVMAKQLPAATDPTHLLQIYSFLHQANNRLSSFLSNTHLQFQPPLRPENSLPSAAAVATAVEENSGGGGEPMQVGDDGDDDDDEEEENISKTSIDKVEERFRDCFIKNKRPKRRLSPSAVAVVEEKRLSEDGFVGGVNAYDPHGAKLRALDLVYQFHG